GAATAPRVAAAGLGGGGGGQDDAGRAVERVLAELGGGCHFVRAESRETTVKTRVLARGQQVVRVDREHTAPISSAAQTELATRLHARLPGAHALVLADYDKGVLSPPLIRHAIDAALGLGVPVVADPRRRNFFSYSGATVFKPNRGELEAALDAEARAGDTAWMEAARVRAGARHLLLTLGAEGMSLASPRRALTRIRARPHAVYDVSGAGDTVAAAVAVSLAADATPREAVELAAAAAAAGVAKVGVATVTREETAALLSSLTSTA
ncbi:MAG: bifunctional heptose 7-phosphate kinase/heptose 1-phosphate adenyltransferase, partial [Gemmatimonadetes bacterium]|nr:bifunctional heptose 7-phosphate kinase/heptose 1-phosphate adenyltransferase [Gemmatimonadota bacterium]